MGDQGIIISMRS